MMVWVPHVVNSVNHSLQKCPSAKHNTYSKITFANERLLVQPMYDTRVTRSAFIDSA